MRQAKAENTTKLREKMELAVERLLAALDAIDGAGQDEDREEDDPGGAAYKEDDEASLGWTDDEAAHGTSELTAIMVDCEEENEHGDGWRA